MTEGNLGIFHIDEEIERFLSGAMAAGRRAETLIKTDGLRVVLVTMRAGVALHEHTAPGPITIHALRGKFAVRLEDQQADLDPGDLVSLQSGVRHAVEALADGAMLLTIGGASTTGAAIH